MSHKHNWPTTSRHERGYGSIWTKTRERILKRDCGLCQPCLKAGYTHMGSEVDHIVSKAEGQRLGWAQDRIECDANLQTICQSAHVQKTCIENGRVFKQKIEIGLDGFPT